MPELDDCNRRWTSLMSTTWIVYRSSRRPWTSGWISLRTCYPGRRRRSESI
jgi:hypothetical protein